MRILKGIKRDDDVCVWTISEISRNTGFSRNTIRAAMDLVEPSRGELGLAFMRPTPGEHRRARKSMVINWMESLERKASHHE